jgi:hypothetical protein
MGYCDEERLLTAIGCAPKSEEAGEIEEFYGSQYCPALYGAASTSGSDP